MNMLEKPSAKKSRASEARNAHGKAEAGRLADEAMAKPRTGDGRRVLVACLPRQRTTAVNSWITQRLAMGHSGSVSRLVTAAANHPPSMRELAKLSEWLKCDT